MIGKSSRAAFAKLQEYARKSEVFKPGKGGSGSHSEEWSGVIFRLGDTPLACNIERVQEILPVPATTPVPGSKPWILGLANVRGSLMTVIDLSWYLTGNRSPITARSRLLATGSQKAPLGLLIDDVYGQRHFLESDSSASALAAESPLQALVHKQYTVGTEYWHEFDLNQLFQSTEFGNGAAT